MYIFHKKNLKKKIGTGCFGYFGYHSKGCLFETPFSALFDYSTNLARVSEEKAGKELKLIKGGYISEGIFNVVKRLAQKRNFGKHGKLHRVRKSYTKERNYLLTTTTKK